MQYIVTTHTRYYWSLCNILIRYLADDTYVELSVDINP